MKIIVLGSGVIGVTTAYQLMKNGHEVTVIDRCSQSAAECSFANGGQLSYSHVEPWASPALLSKLPLWLVKKNSPLVFRPKFEKDMWLWSLKFLASCTRRKVQESTQNMVRLSLYSKKCFEEIDSELSIDYAKISKGTMHIFKSEAALKFNIKQAEFQKSLGCEFEVLADRSACEDKEPCLKYSPSKIIGGIYFPIDETGDINKFTLDLAKILQSKGVKFEYNTDVEEILTDGTKITGIKTNKGEMQADSYVVALGASSPLLLRKIGVKVPIYPMKGYSISIKIKDYSKVPAMGVTDQSNKIVFSRLGDILRVAGTAEIAGYDYSVQENRIKTIKNMAQEVLPDCGDIENASSWSCLRPSTPDGDPIIGKTKYKNLFLNTGHGTLGWTLSCGSAKIIAAIIDGREPEIDLNGLDIKRFY